jgi:hypothetical protein
MVLIVGQQARVMVRDIRRELYNGKHSRLWCFVARTDAHRALCLAGLPAHIADKWLGPSRKY